MTEDHIDWSRKLSRLRMERDAFRRRRDQLAAHNDLLLKERNEAESERGEWVKRYRKLNEHRREHDAELRKEVDEAKRIESYLRRCLLCIEQLAEGAVEPTGFEAEEIQPAAEAIYRLRREASLAAMERQPQRPVLAILLTLVGAAVGSLVTWGLA